MNETATSDPNSRASGPNPAAAIPPVVDSAELLRGGREVIIRHGGEDYRLRLTRAGKLILNK